MVSISHFFSLPNFSQLEFEILNHIHFYFQTMNIKKWIPNSFFNFPFFVTAASIRMISYIENKNQLLQAL